MLTIPQAARLLGVTRNTVWRWVRDGILPATKVGVYHFIDPQDLKKITRPKPGRPITKPSPNQRGRKPKGQMK